MKQEALFMMEAQDCIWIVTDLVISPKSERYLIYSTHTGILHFIDLEKLQNGCLNEQKVNLAAMAPSSFSAGDEM